jgi:hypothetical protein
MAAECHRRWEVDAYREGKLGARDAGRFERHVRICASCARQMERDEGLRRMVRELPDGEPDALELRRIRGNVMRDLATGVASPARPRWVLAAAGVAVAVAGLVAWRVAARSSVPGTSVVVGTPAELRAPVESPSVPSAQAFAGSVGALAASRWTQTREDGVERVLLEAGWVRIHVRPQHEGERFLVEVPDGELEVRGTTFEVTVENAQTTGVHVDDGVVELRLRGRDPERLAAGDLWPASAPVVATATTVARPAPSVPARLEPVRDGAAEAYKAAMQLLLAGRDAEAAAAFEAFLLAHPGAPQSEDASYLEAVALARAGRTDAAALAAEQHLRRFPSSFHTKEAAGLVALAASQRGDCARVRAVVAEWSHGQPDRDTQAALKACDGK